MGKKQRNENKDDGKNDESEKISIPTMTFQPHAEKILEHLKENGGSTNRKAIETLIHVHGGALNHVIKSMKLYNLMMKPAAGHKFKFTAMSQEFQEANAEDRKKIYAKAIISVPIFRKLVMDKNFTERPSASTLKKIFVNEYKITGSQSSKLANIFKKNWDFLDVDFLYFQKLLSGDYENDSPTEPLRVEMGGTRVDLSESNEAKRLSLELLYAVTTPRAVKDIVAEIIAHKNEFAPEKRTLIEALENVKNDDNKLKIGAEMLAESLAGAKSKKPKDSDDKKK